MIQDYMKEVRDVCTAMDWKKDWCRGGCYLHLEVSEFIEACRGKGDPVDELGDVIFTLLAVADYYGIDPLAAIEMNKKKQREKIKEGSCKKIQ